MKGDKDKTHSGESKYGQIIRILEIKEVLR